MLTGGSKEGQSQVLGTHPGRGSNREEWVVENPSKVSQDLILSLANRGLDPSQQRSYPTVMVEREEPRCDWERERVYLS